VHFNSSEGLRCQAGTGIEKWQFCSEPLMDF